MSTMDRTAEVDVIILSMDRAADTIDAIASALEQEGVTKHVWVVDQGSAPDTIAALQGYIADKPEVSLTLLERNLGVAGGRNVASRLGRSPYIVSLDNDATFCDRSMLAEAVRHLEADRSLGAIGFRILNYYTGRDDDSSWRYPRALQNKYDQAFLTTRFPGGGHAIRRDAFERAGGYDDALFFNWEELDLCYRLINLGYRIKYVPDVSIYHKVSPEHRVSWKNGRYYYLVRNSLYVRFKYGAPISRLAAFAAGYTLKGLVNGITLQALRGVSDAVGMCVRFSRVRQENALVRLSPGAEAYIFENDVRYRGSIWQRLRREVLAKMPASAGR